MKYKVIAFDLDGTLVNSLTDLANAMNFALKKAGLDTHPVEAYKKFVGDGRENLVIRAMGKSASDEKLRTLVRESFDEYYAVHCNDNTASYPGCAEMLEQLHREGVGTIVLSNKPDEFVDKILRKAYPNHCFSLAWGKKPEYPVKPDGAPLTAMLLELGVEKCDCLYVGDSDVDVFTARNSGVDMIGVDWGFRGREELLGAGAPFVAKKASDILEYINE